MQMVQEAGESGATEGRGETPRERWSARRKTDVVLRLIRGDDLVEVSREIQVAPHELDEWRWVFSGRGQRGLKSRSRGPVQREEIALLRVQGLGVRSIARRLERSPCTISRELRRDAATRSGDLEYRATTARWRADVRAERPKPGKLATNELLRRYLQDRLGGLIATPEGDPRAGPRVTWAGRRRAPRCLGTNVASTPDPGIQRKPRHHDASHTPPQG